LTPAPPTHLPRKPAGPASIDVIRLARRSGWRAVRGNHESSLLTVVGHLVHDRRSVDLDGASGLGEVLTRTMRRKCEDASRVRRLSISPCALPLLTVLSISLCALPLLTGCFLRGSN